MGRGGWPGVIPLRRLIVREVGFAQHPQQQAAVLVVEHGQGQVLVGAELVAVEPGAFGAGLLLDDQGLQVAE